ncbi:GlxA family transcriptional regulator [Chitinimonas naiadis]
MQGDVATIPVYFVLLPGYLLLDFAGPAEALRIANQRGGRFDVCYTGPEVQASNSLGLPLNGLLGLPERLPEGAWVIIPGLSSAMANEESPASRKTIDWLSRVWRPDIRLITICSAALLAAAAGLLTGRRCTTHHSLITRLRKLAPDAKVEDDRIFVLDRNIASSAGITTGIDLTLELIALAAGPQVALEVAREMVVWLRRDGDASQHSPYLSYRNHLHPAVHRAQDAITASPDRAWSIPELAQVACVSPRHLARLFKQHAGVGPSDYHQLMQLAHVEQLLHQPALSLERIAEASGFGSARDLRRVWLRHRGSALRRIP